MGGSEGSKTPGGWAALSTRSHKSRGFCDSCEQGSLSTGGGRGVSGTSNVHGGFLSPLLSPEEVRRVQAGGVPRLEHFLLYQKQITWTLSLSGLTRKMEGLLPPWDWEMGKNGTGGRWGNVKAVN